MILGEVLGDIKPELLLDLRGVGELTMEKVMARVAKGVKVTFSGVPVE